MADSISTRTEILVGREGIERLRSASVVLCGCGAVGGYAFEGLIRAGIGTIRVVDKDVFSESNLNRQILATMDTIGMPKVEAARRRALSINPQARIETMDALVSEETIPDILDGDFDVLVDAIDTMKMKTLLLQAACEAGIRTFSSMGAALHMDASAVRIAPVMESRVCPVASRVRSALRGYDASRITCVYSEERPLTAPDSRDEHGKSVLGSMPTIPAIFGMTLANEAIRHILGQDVLRRA
ncbi:MAG: tRNA threonylcarbamoyladenosine dehydratase [Candidatus Methanomethylophilaceae archaeon]|nr:tRNA threonylcarbamoyladenosine dehydratase [Candidatus Methanomethylophilaceae archaeon]